MKKVLFGVLLATTINANASQAIVTSTCFGGVDYSGHHKVDSVHEADIENTTDTVQNIHIRMVNTVNGPWVPTVREWDAQIAPHSWYHSKRQELTHHFHQRENWLYIQTVTTEVTGFITNQDVNTCYYRVKKD